MIDRAITMSANGVSQIAIQADAIHLDVYEHGDGDEWNVGDSDRGRGKR